MEYFYTNLYLKIAFQGLQLAGLNPLNMFHIHSVVFQYLRKFLTSALSRVMQTQSTLYLIFYQSNI